MTDIEQGDVVQLKSGSKPMTVYEVHGNEVTCTWMTEAGERKIDVWPANNLVRVSAKDVPYVLRR
jgi:uncharacterized protein YodC (DUF2158 family)